MTSLRRVSASILRVVVHLVLTINLRPRATGRDFIHEMRELVGKIVALPRENRQPLLALVAKGGVCIFPTRLLAHVKDLQLDNAEFIDQGPDCLSHARCPVRCS